MAVSRVFPCHPPLSLRSELRKISRLRTASSLLHCRKIERLTCSAPARPHSLPCRPPAFQAGSPFCVHFVPRIHSSKDLVNDPFLKDI